MTTQKPDDEERQALERAADLERHECWPELLEHLERSARRWPSDEWLMQRARIHSWLGQLEAARADWQRVLVRSPDHAGSACALVLAGYGEDAGGLERIERLLDRQAPGSETAARLGYARGRLLEAGERFDEAFEQYRRSNALRAARGGMDIRAKQRGARAVIADLRAEVIEKLDGKGAGSSRPVFIVGMPRSGTSLTEQILAAHPDVYAMGEQLFLGEVLRELLTAAPDGYGSMPEAIDAQGSDVWRRAGEAYLARVARLDDQARRVTDKLPANFGLLPWIRLLLPAARIIHLRREPLATMLSCIRTPFSEPTLAFTVEDWARFHGLYQALMARWRPLLGDRMLEVDYEELVADLPGQVRRVLDFLELEWNDACLHPERARHVVRTASSGQVRRSVHDRSVQGWRRYREQLEPLLPLVEESRRFVSR
jgi:tetratricopeptide (TPR) repeat protein